MPSGTNIACILKHGNQNLGTDTTVEVTWSGAGLNQGTLYEFKLFELFNPPTPSDDRHIVIVMTSQNSAG